MPVVKGERAARPTATPAPAPVVAPAQVRSPGAIKTSVEPRAPLALAPKPERPVPALQAHNFQGGINQFNERVQSVHDSYTQAYGVAPSPALTFDLATSPVDAKDFGRMFTVPQSQFAARNRGALTAQGIHEIPEPAYGAKDIANQIVKAAAAGDYHSFIQQNIETIHDLSSGHKDDAATIAGAIFKARRLEAFRDVETKVNNGDLSAAAGREQLQEMGFVPGGAAFHALKGVGGELALGIGQIADSLVHAPAGLYELGKAAGLDTRDIVLHPGSSSHFERTAPIGKAVVKGVKEDVQHPLRNPGYLFLDILGFAAPVAGAGARAAEAGRLLRAGEGVGAAGKALTRKPLLQRVTLNHGGFTEEMPLSQNPMVAAVQKYIVGRRQAGAAAKLETGDTPSGLLSVLKPQIAQDFLDKTVSFPKKLGREADTRKRVDHIVQMTLSRELDHVAGRAVTQARIQSAVPSKLRGALTRGEQKAIQVHSWDDTNPLQAERDFHNRMIEMGVGDPKAHARQIADLKLAERAMKNPSPRLVKALELTRRVVADMEAIKIRDLGLNAVTAEGRVARAGEVLRGSASDVTARFDRQIRSNPDLAAAEYEKRFGNVVNTDNARELSPDYAASIESRSRLAAAVHEPASALAKDVYARYLARPAAKDQTVHFTAGGTGAGKSRISRGVEEHADIVFDTNLNNFGSSVKKIDQALASGRKVEIHYVHRDHADSLTRGALPRAEEHGRTVPLNEHVKTHVGANAAIRKLAAKYAADSRVKVRVFHNGPDEFLEIGLSDLPKLKYTEVSNEVRAAFQAEREAGRVSDRVAEGTAGRLGAGDHAGERGAGAGRESAHSAEALVRQNPDSFYLPTQPRGKVKRGPSDRPGYFPTKAGPFGVPLGRALPELTHEFTGKALMAGDIRIDATSLATEAYGRTVRSATVRAEHSKLWAAAHDTKRSRFDVPIRDSNTIPDALRTVIARLDEGDFTAADAEALPADARKLIEELYPSEAKVAAEQIDGVKWVDARLLGEGSTLPHVPGLAADVAQTFNAPLRFATLYLRPAYILNKLGNHAMLWFDQGIHTVPNFIKAMSAESRYGAENARTMRELVGAGKSASYVTSSSGKISHAVSDFWARVADRDERMTALIFYQERKGYKTRAQVDSLLHDPAKRADLVEITRRANKSLVEFDNLTPIEKNYIRHFIFVYPWVSRSAVYSIRAILEHPTKVDLLSHLGRQEFEDDPIFKHAPDWFKRTGYIPVGWNADGTPRVVNPTSVNTFSTLGDFIALGRAVTVGDKYSSAADFLGPFPKYLMHAGFGRDDQGNQYPGSQWGNAAKEVLMQLPQIAALERKGKYKPGDNRKVDIANRASLQTALNANLKKTVLTPGWLDGYGSFFAGGFSPRDINLDALAARYWKDQDPKVRHGRELDLLNRALNVQADVLGTPLPKAVKAAVNDQANLDYAYKTFLKDTGRAPTDKERAGFTLDYLHKQGLISDTDRSKYAATLKPLADPSDISRFKGMLLDKYANGKALRQWDTDIRALASFTPEIVNQKAGELFKQGLVPQKAYRVSQETLYAYGRKYVQFTHDAQALQQKITDGEASTADMRAFQDLHDKPVNGLPSFVRMAWANLTHDEQQQAIASNVTASWSTLTAFDKALLGRPSDPKVTAGWAKLKEITNQQSVVLKREGRSWPAGYTRTLVKYVERYYDAPGLVKDYDFSRQPLYARMKYLAPIQQSPNKALWTQVLTQAAAMHKYLAAKDDLGGHVYDTTQVRQSWKDYVDSAGFQAWLGEHPSFKAEVDAYGRATLAALVS